MKICALLIQQTKRFYEVVSFACKHGIRFVLDFFYFRECGATSTKNWCYSAGLPFSFKQELVVRDYIKRRQRKLCDYEFIVELLMFALYRCLLGALIKLPLVPFI